MKENESKRKQTSTDFHWFSPILKEELANIHVDGVVSPTEIDELKILISHCVKEQIPLTVRGGGTGNYGQSLPLHGGIVIDFSLLNNIFEFDEKNGVVHVQAGIRLKKLEDYCQNFQWELRCKPSTFKIATLGGFFAGGFGGIGSINYGPLNAVGNILSLRILTIEKEPKIIELNAFEAAEYAHTYGTTGIVLDVHLALAKSEQWQECVLTFPSFEQAFRCAEFIAHDPAISKKEIAVFSETIEKYYDHLKNYIQEGESTILMIIKESYLNLLENIAFQFSGKMSFHQSAEEAEKNKFSILDYCWNHATLSVLKYDRNQTYLQTSYVLNQEVNQLSIIRHHFGKEKIIHHIEFIRNAHGKVSCSGLPIIKYKNNEELKYIMKIHEQAGIRINDPHTIYVEDGHHSKSLNKNILEYKKKNDPYNLLNMGKLSKSH